MSRSWQTKAGIGLALGCIAILGYYGQIYNQINKKVGKDFLNNSSCVAPCWQSIVPGITSQADVLLVVQDMGIKSFKITGNKNKGEISWEWPIFSFGRVPDKIFWENQIVSEIQIGTALEMEDVISKFGPPNSVNISMGGNPEHWYWVINMFYPLQKARFIAFTEEYSHEISPSSEVGVAVYYAEFPEGMPPGWRSDVEPWKGYGNIISVYGKR